jgi:UDP-glucose:(galactosyl)LPS alpha-1,2-glucosyltransferase
MSGGGVQRNLTVVEVCCAFDSHLVTAAEVTLYSLAVNAAIDTRYRVSVLCSERGLDNVSRQRLQQVFRDFPQHSIRFLGVGNQFEGAFEIRGITVSTYYRLLLPELMSDITRVLYLDVDLIVRDDLRSLFEVDLEGMYLGGVKGIFTNIRDDRVQSLGISSGCYVNAGVLLFNLDLMRKDGLQDDFVSMVSGNYEFQDQDILNIRCAGKIGHLHPRYNIHAMFDYLENREFCDGLFGAGVALEAVAAPCIIHYAGKKPWQSVDCFYYDVWWEYYRRCSSFSLDFYLDHQRSVHRERAEIRERKCESTETRLASWRSIARDIVRRLRGR